MEKVVKITVGYVVQDYVGANCTGQVFIAGDQVSYENKFGDEVNRPDEEIYQPLEMVQPCWDYYFVVVWGCVDPNLHGPYNIAKARDKAMTEMIEQEGEETNAFYRMEATKGSKIEL